jgi:hypothetical protein
MVEFQLFRLMQGMFSVFNLTINQSNLADLKKELGRFFFGLGDCFSLQSKREQEDAISHIISANLFLCANLRRVI